MKSLLITKAIFLFSLFLITGNIKAQTASDYINFYNDIVPKLNSIIPNKTQFYGKPFSNFYSELQNKNINVKGWIFDPKIVPSTKYYVLKIFLCDVNMLGAASRNSFVYPLIIITFEEEIPSQVVSLMEQNHAVWNPTVAQFFSSLKIEKIEFSGVKGYNVKDWSE
ncbi:hypothetical protein [Chryseobacterium sp.]|uniref:hypothetical protein n=1 Tax=Chryseobacterium sp. TaxID=1871047 RepID=UPI0025C09307|nr:hypothetical protein [Chryseobacterium sp.]